MYEKCAKKLRNIQKMYKRYTKINSTIQYAKCTKNLYTLPNKNS